MINSYKQLFQLNIQHDFFNKSSPLQSIVIEPSKLNNANNLKLRVKENGYVIFSKNLPERNLNESTTSIFFDINFLDPSFLNYSNLYFLPQKVLYFSSKYAVDGIIESSKGVSLDLHNKQFIFPITLEDLKILTSISLINSSGNSQNIPFSENPENGGVPIDLEKFPDGKYELQLTFEEESKNISYSFFSTNQAVNYAIFEFFLEEFEVPTYSLSFEGRSTYLRYFLILEKEWEAIQFSSIEIGQQKIEFEKIPKAIELTNGQPSFLAISSHPILLQESPAWKINITLDNNEIILPYPDKRKLSKPLLEDGAKEEHLDFYYSDVYVYL